MPIQLYNRSLMPGMPGMKTDFSLFIGPVCCSYHNGGGSIGNERNATFCPTDVQIALGIVEDSVVDAVRAIRDAVDFPIRSIAIRSACQSAFCGVNFDMIRRAVRDELGILCVHSENCRILAKHSKSGGMSGMGGAGASPYEQLLLENKRVQSSNPPILMLNGSCQFDESNELVFAARSWGFDGVVSLGDITSPEALDRACSCGFIISAQASFDKLAAVLSKKWDVDWIPLHTTIDLEIIDRQYGELQMLLGDVPELDEFRDRACSALDFLHEARGNQAITLSEPDEIIEALLRMGFDAERDEEYGRMQFPMRGPRGGGRGADGPRNNAPNRPRKRSKEQANDPRFLRSGDVHFPTSGPSMRTQKGRQPQMPFVRNSLPSFGERWGYCCLYDCATRLAEEVQS